MSDARERLIEAMGTADCEWLMGHEGGGLPHMASLLNAALARRDDLLEALGGEQVPWGTVRLGETTWRFPLMADDASLKSAARRLDAEWERNHGRPT